MDRIVCGDVGFGKTEVAFRTMIRAIKSGYQTAMICPTTILANQHFQNFKEKVIKEAVENELKRKGQVYYLHNWVETIGAVKNFLEKLVPNVKFGIAHGRLKKRISKSNE